MWVEFQFYFVKLWKAIKAFWYYSSVLGRSVLYNLYLLWKRPKSITYCESCHSEAVCVCVCVFRQSAVSDSAAPYTVASQAPLSMGFYRQEFWSRLPFPTPVGFPNPRDWTGLNLCLCHLLHWQADSLLLAPTWEAPIQKLTNKKFNYGEGWGAWKRTGIVNLPKMREAILSHLSFSLWQSIHSVIIWFGHTLPFICFI